MFVAVCAIAFTALWRFDLVPTWQEGAVPGFDLAAGERFHARDVAMQHRPA